MSTKDKILHQSEINAINIVVDLNRKLSLYASDLDFPSFLAELANEPFPIQQLNEKDIDFRNRAQSFHEKWLQNIGLAEQLLHPGSSANFFRDLFSNDPFFKNCAGTRGTSNVDTFSNNRITPGLVSSSLRSRSFDNVSIAGLLFMACNAVASSSSARPFVNAAVDQDSQVPRVFVEALQSNRRSVVKQAEIGASFVPIPREYLKILNLELTILDFEYLCTQRGVSALMSVFTRVKLSPDNYIEYSSLTRMVEFDSGETITANAFACVNAQVISSNVDYIETDSVTGTRTTKSYVSFIEVGPSLHLLPTNNYGTNINGVHAIDSRILHRKLKSLPLNLPVDISMHSIQYNVTAPSQQLSIFIIKRMTTLHNGPKKPNNTLPSSTFSASPSASLSSPGRSPRSQQRSVTGQGHNPSPQTPPNFSSPPQNSGNPSVGGTLSLSLDKLKGRELLSLLMRLLTVNRRNLVLSFA